MAKTVCGGGGLQKATEGGVRALWKRLRAGKRSVLGLGAGRLSKWGRRASSRYAQLPMGKADLGVWKERLGTGLGSCHLCREDLETGGHLVFKCPKTREGVGWQWARWIELDDRAKWAYEFEEAGCVWVGDRMEDFFTWLDRELGGVG